MNKQEVTNRKQCIMKNSRRNSYHQAKSNDKLTREQALTVSSDFNNTFVLSRPPFYERGVNLRHRRI